MEDRKARARSRDFPPTADGVSKMLDDFRSQRAREDGEKELSLKEAASMAQELKVFEQKKKKDLGLPAIADLEKVIVSFWRMIATKDTLVYTNVARVFLAKCMLYTVLDLHSSEF